MKIQDLASFRGMTPMATGTERHEQDTRMPSFPREMSRLTKTNCEQRLNEMHTRIVGQGRVLSDRCDILELKRYKEMVAEFMHEAVRFAFEYKKQSTLDARGRHRLFALIKRINLKLEELTQLMLSGEAGNLEIMAAVDELRGMLLDIYM